jgi:single-stranded-DNA-specific exonuclease
VRDHGHLADLEIGFLMALQNKRWQWPSRPPTELLSCLPHLSPVLVQILYNRGLSDPVQIRRHLANSEPLESPFHLKGVNQAVTRIRQALKNDKTIAIYGDFDVDGVTATALLVQVLKALGARVIPYIPHRIDEGYGLNQEALRWLKKKGIGLVITADCGVRSIKEAHYAKRLGLDLIITDHHSIGSEELPPATAIINPQQPDCPYSFKKLSGVGVAYRLAQALLMVERQMSRRSAPPIQAEDLLDLVALGTVADIVPLIGENRALVSQGLQHLNNTQRPGLQSLFLKAGLRSSTIDATKVGFILGPRLNAAGRLQSAMLAYELVMTTDVKSASANADTLEALNRKRQALTEYTFERAKAQTEERLDSELILFAAAEDFHPGVVGLVAGKLTETYHRPAIVMEIGAQITRGSARSIPEFHITEALDRCRSLLVRYGGHAAAAGFTVENDKRSALLEQLRAIAADEIGRDALSPSLHLDAEVSLNDLSFDLWQTLRQLEPCGYGNETPILCLRNVRVLNSHIVGSDNTHLKLRLGDEFHSFDAIAFHQAERKKHLPPLLDVAFTLGIDEWNGQRRLQLNVQDIRPASITPT